jgi:hypothetical protein
VALANSLLFFLSSLQGVGVIWPTAIGRLEINLAQVLRRHATDQIRSGLQFGFTTTI